MIEDGGIRPEECIYEPCSDILSNYGDMRSRFGNKPLGEIMAMNTRRQENAN